MIPMISLPNTSTYEYIYYTQEIMKFITNFSYQRNVTSVSGNDKHENNHKIMTIEYVIITNYTLPEHFSI